MTHDGASLGTNAEEVTFRKVRRHLVPFLMLCYAVAYLDRVNVGFAKLQMLTALGFSESVYGLGAGTFFVGYFLFEVPSNLILHRVGARVWIARIMITWGAMSALTIFVRTPLQFYTLRFLLGLAEAGLYPGIILYLTYWFPSRRRAHVVALFMTAIPISGILGGPLSGWIMQFFSGVRGLSGWQWMFLLESIPAILVGGVSAFYLDSGVLGAKWLTNTEKQLITDSIANDQPKTMAHSSPHSVFADRRVYLMSFIYFCCVMGQYGITFWLPTLIQGAAAKSPLTVGLLSAIPYVFTVITMVLVGRSADRHHERRWHLAAPMFVGALGLLASTVPGQPMWLAIACLTVASAGIITAAPLFWSLPTSFLTGVNAAAGIAAINSVGNLAGIVSPTLIGRLNDYTHANISGMYVLSGVLIGGALTVLGVPKKSVTCLSR